MIARALARLAGEHLADAGDYHALKGSALLRPEIDDEGFGAGGLNADAEARDFVVPGDPWSDCRLQSLDCRDRQFGAQFRDPSAGFSVHAQSMACPLGRVNRVGSTIRSDQAAPR